MEEGGDDGKVQVFARIRPMGHVDCTPAVQTDARSQAVHVLLASDSTHPAAEAHEFRFDGVFDSGNSQGDVFECVGAPVLQGLLRGLNGTILAYGQTGSGKTHSLLNPGCDQDDAGLLPRLVKDLFGSLAADRSSDYRVEAAAMQVYNEQLDDLLHQRHQSGEGMGIHVQNGGIVSDLTWVDCPDAKALKRVFSRARANLIYAETRMNKTSSRSHAIFQIRLTRQIESKCKTCTCARLSVVDLAGSERIKKSGVEGVHFREATAINKSLLALGNVVSALAARKRHVPFRDSNLTRILEGCLGGNCKTAMLVCASPAQEHVHETLCSLEFASRAMNIEVHARVNRIVAVHTDPSPTHSQTEAEVIDYKVGIALQVEHAHKTLLEVTLRAELAEARAIAVEAAIAKRERDVFAAESALQAESNKSSDHATGLEAELTREKRFAADSLTRLRKQAEEAKQLTERLEMKLVDCTKELHARSEELCLRSAELEEARSTLEKREAEIIDLECHHRSEIGELHSALRNAECRVEVFEKMVIDARIDTEKAIAQAQKASETLEADFVTKERERLDNQYKETLESQKMNFEAKLEAGLQSMEAQLSDAKRRSEAELGRRFMLVEGREQDAQKIVQLQEQVDKLFRDLEFRRREVDGHRRRLKLYDTCGRSLAQGDSSRGSSRCSSAPVTPPSMSRDLQEKDELEPTESTNKRRLVPLTASADKLINPRPSDSTRCLPALATKSSAVPPVMRSRGQKGKHMPLEWSSLRNSFA